jgi:uncharacterized protein YndB with AHSA1/START domain
MERKTKIHAEDGKQELTITREFDLPVDLLFRAHVEPGIVEQWMGTKVLKLECRNHGSFQFVTTDPAGNKHGFNGVIHEFVPDEKITRTFEMENSPFGVQLDFIEFEQLGGDRSRLKIHTVFRSAAVRDELLKLPFSFGINMAHDRLEEIAGKLR